MTVLDNRPTSRQPVLGLVDGALTVFHDADGVTVQIIIGPERGVLVEIGMTGQEARELCLLLHGTDDATDTGFTALLTTVTCRLGLQRAA